MPSVDGIQTFDMMGGAVDLTAKVMHTWHLLAARSRGAIVVVGENFERVSNSPLTLRPMVGAGRGWNVAVLLDPQYSYAQ